MKLKKPRKMLPDETVMKGDEFRYKTDGDYWFEAIPFLGDTVKDFPEVQFRTYRPLPKKKEKENEIAVGECVLRFSLTKDGIRFSIEKVKE